MRLRSWPLRWVRSSAITALLSEVKMPVFGLNTKSMAD